MIIELLIASVLGVIAGTFTGLAPGIHINLVAAFVTASIYRFSSFPLIAVAAFIAAMSITHTFLDFIPSIYLGAPEEDTFLSILPGHELTMQGKGHIAVVSTLYGSLTALLIIIVFAPLYILLLPSFYVLIKSAIPFILIFISFYLILRDKDVLLSLIVFALAAFLGLFTFNLPVKEPLMPLLSGLFGISGLLVSIKNKSKIKKQVISPLKKIKLTKKEFFKASLAAIISGPLCSFLPGIGSGHAATIGSEIIPQERKGFLFLNGAINTIIMALSFVTIYSIGKARSGTAAAVKEILTTISVQNIIILLIIMILAGILSFFLGVKVSKICAKYLNKINYTKSTLVVIVILIALNLFFTNWIGLIVLLTSTALGIFAILSGSKRINLMAALIIPAVLYYLTS